MRSNRRRDANNPVRQLKRQDRMSANDLCPCGSGKKFKKCCRIGIQERMARQMTEAGAKAFLKDQAYKDRVKRREKAGV